MRKWALTLAAAVLAVPAPAASAQQITMTLREAFSPDPHLVSVRAGGDVSVADLDAATDECGYGYVAMSGIVDLDYTRSLGSDLYIYAEGDGDIMLFVVPPSGDAVCDDDTHEGLNPLVHIPSPQSGRYAVVVGTYTQNEAHDATLFVSRSQPDGGSVSTSSASAGTPSLSSEPTYGRVTLDGNFTPDPHTLSLSAGGGVDVDVSGCGYGYVANAPDYNLTYTGSGSALSFYVRSDEDTTLLINRPDASWICDDDSLGDSNPVVTIPNAPSGLYNIWVGTYSDSGLTSATLYISKKAPN